MTVAQQPQPAAPALVPTRTHRIAILYGSEEQGRDVVGAIVLGAEGALALPEARLFQIVGQRLFPAAPLHA